MPVPVLFLISLISTAAVESSTAQIVRTASSASGRRGGDTAGVEGKSRFRVHIRIGRQAHIYLTGNTHYGNTRQCLEGSL